MTAFPSDLSSQRSVGQMQNDLDDFLAATQEIFAGGASSVTPSAGALTTNTPVTFVTGSGATTIDSITYTHAKTESVIMIVPDASALPLTVTLSAALLRGFVNYVMQNGECLLLRRSGSSWVEITRLELTSQGMIDFLSLGTAAFKNEGPGSGLDADTLQGSEPSDFLAVGGTAEDSNALQGLPASAFLQLAVASLQQMAGTLQIDGGLLRILGSIPTRHMRQGAIDRHTESLNASGDLRSELFDAVGSLQSVLRRDNADGDIYYTNVQEAGSERIMTPGKIDALTLEGRRLLEVSIIESGRSVTANGVVHSDGVGTEIPGISITIPTAGRYRLRAWISHRPNQSGIDNRAFNLVQNGTNILGAFPIIPNIAVDDYCELLEVTATLAASDVVTLTAWRNGPGSNIDSDIYGADTFAAAGERQSAGGVFENLQTRTHITAERIA